MAAPLPPQRLEGDQAQDSNRAAATAARVGWVVGGDAYDAVLEGFFARGFRGERTLEVSVVFPSTVM